MAYPASIDSFSNPQGTSLLSNDHALEHRNVGTAIIAVQNVIGTTAGTAILKNFTAGQFAARTNNETFGTPSVVGGTITGAMLGTNTIQGGTANNQVIGTPAITGGTITSSVINNSTVGTPAITGGTANTIVLGTPTLQGTVVNTANLADAAVTSRKVQLQYAGTIIQGTNFVQTTSGGTWYDVTGGSLVINPAVNSVVDINFHGVVTNNLGTGRVDVGLLYNGTMVGNVLAVSDLTVQNSPVAINYIGTIPSGAGTIKIQISNQGAQGNVITFIQGGYSGLFAKYWSI